MGKPALISIVSPVYGCRNCLHALAERTREAFEGSGLDWELVLVDDRAKDNPWPVISELAEGDARIRGVRLSRNHGQHLAIWAGLAEARGDFVAVIDCDLQDDPALIPALVEQQRRDGSDAVVVDRGEWKDTGLRRFASRMFGKVLKLLSGVELSSNIGNFGLYSRRMVDVLLQFHDKEVFLPMMVSLTGLPVTLHTSDNRSDRAAGKSSYNLRRLIRIAIAIIIRFADRPLKLSVVVGLAFSGLSALASVVLLALWGLGWFTVPGWTSLMLSLWFLSGLIMAVLGVQGFYIGRIFAEVQNRPRIIVESRTD